MKKSGVFCFVLSLFSLIQSARAGDLPLCDDEMLMAVVSEQIQDISKLNTIDSPINIRFSELVLKYTNVLKEVNIENFDAKEDFDISDRIMELKINKNLEFKDMRLCKGVYEKGENKTYALLYENGENINVFVVTSIGDKIKRTDKTIEN